MTAETLLPMEEASQYGRKSERLSEETAYNNPIMKLCECGCGRPTRIATGTERGWVKGQALRFIHGHNGSRWIDPVKRFWSKVDKTESCWLWMGSLCRLGYGNFSIRNKSLKAHRYSYELHNGPIPEGMDVCHKCDVRNCVNPSHFFLGTQADNNRDKCEKGRQPKGESTGSAKLTALDVIAMRILNAQGIGHRKLAKEFGVADTVARRAIRGRTWKHIPLECSQLHVN